MNIRAAYKLRSCRERLRSQGLLTVEGQLHRVSLGLQGTLQEPRHSRLVLGYQNPHVTILNELDEFIVTSAFLKVVFRLECSNAGYMKNPRPLRSTKFVLCAVLVGLLAKENSK